MSANEHARFQYEAGVPPADEAALDYIATRIATKFGVSAEVIAKRLRVEKLRPPRASDD